MDKATILNNHLEFKRISVKSEGKIQDIKRYVSKFINYTKKPLSKFNENDVSKFLNSLDYSIGTINDIKAYIKVFIRWHYPDWSSRFRNLDMIENYGPQKVCSGTLKKEEKSLIYFQWESEGLDVCSSGDMSQNTGVDCILVKEQL